MKLVNTMFNILASSDEELTSKILSIESIEHANFIGLSSYQNVDLMHRDAEISIETIRELIIESIAEDGFLTTVLTELKEEFIDQDDKKRGYFYIVGGMLLPMLSELQIALGAQANLYRDILELGGTSVVLELTMSKTEQLLPRLSSVPTIIPSFDLKTGYRIYSFLDPASGLATIKSEEIDPSNNNYSFVSDISDNELYGMYKYLSDEIKKTNTVIASVAELYNMVIDLYKTEITYFVGDVEKIDRLKKLHSFIVASSYSINTLLDVSDFGIRELNLVLEKNSNDE